MVISVILCSGNTFGQLYRGVRGLEPHKKNLAQIESYLSLSPNKSRQLINKLRVDAKKTDNNTLTAVLDIYEGTYLYYTGQSDSAIIFFEKADKVARKLKNEQLSSTATIRKLFVLQGNNDSKPILTLMRDEYEIAKKNKDTINMIYSLNGQALCLDNLDSTKSCINIYLKAIKLSKESGNEYEYGFLLNNLGLLKLRLNSPEDGIKDLRKGITIAQKLNNIRLEVTLRDNVGLYYMRVDSMELALKEYEYTYKLATSRKFYHIAFVSIVNLGSVHRQLGDYKKSDSLLNMALQMGKREKLYYAVSPIFLTMAQLALHADKHAEIPALLDSALAYSAYTSKNDIQEGIFQIKYQLYEKQGDLKNALIYYKKLSNFRDSLDKTGHMQMITELQLKYDVERKEKQRVEENIMHEREKEYLKQNIALGIILFTLIIGGFVIYYFKEKHKREALFSSALVNKLEEERGRIARDLHDGLGQSLIILKNKFNNSDASAETIEQINQNFTETIEEVRSISRSLIPPELRRLGLQKSINKMLLDIEESTSIMATYELDILSELNLDSGAEIRIYRIIQELTNNTIKHSHATSLKIVFEKIGNRLIITYQDNGKGINDEALASEKSIGFKSIEQRLKFLNGTLKIDRSAKGFKAIIRIKLPTQ